jgi:thioredoxin 1
MSRVRTITAQDFSREVFFSPVPVVVDAYADWCGPCRALAPLLERLDAHYDGRLQFLKVNIDDDPEVAEVFRVEAVPTLLLFRGGRLTDRIAGLSDPRNLVAKLDRLAGVGIAANS